MIFINIYIYTYIYIFIYIYIYICVCMCFAIFGKRRDVIRVRRQEDKKKIINERRTGRMDKWTNRCKDGGRTEEEGSRNGSRESETRTEAKCVYVVSTTAQRISNSMAGRRLYAHLLQARTCARVCTHTHAHTRANARTHARARARTHTHTHTHKHKAHTSTHTRAFTCLA